MLVVGGSLTGLSAALFLAHHGVRCVLVERHLDTSPHFRFRGIAARSMECFRGVGIEAAVRAASTQDQRAGGVARMANLAAADVAWLPTPWEDDIAGLSPCAQETCDQDQLEPVLRREAIRRGADVRFGTELLEFHQDADAVHAVVRDRTAEKRYQIRASYLIAADGVHSPVREALGIGRTGPGVLEDRMSVLFRTDLDAAVRGRRFTACVVDDIAATLVPRAGGAWMMTVPFDPRAGAGTGSHWAGLVRAASGRQDAVVELVDTLSWQCAALLADRFHDGRVFLVGDAAHVMPPTGGFGGNTGIHDAFNLAWKLSFVTRGAAPPALLDSYERECRPVAQHTMDQALARHRRWFPATAYATGPAPDTTIVDDNTVMFGYHYRGPGHPPFDEPARPTGLPGTRAPHAPLDEHLSTLDRFGCDLVLLGADPWRVAAARISTEDRIPLRDHSARTGDGVTGAGAVLVRPDGFIAWRCDAAVDDHTSVLRGALDDLGLVTARMTYR
ncbi:FAD-dependent oxidoreductase [Amycolatopsis minnesotensis]|uniref:FAD-dependent oxidoreductase n=1 Tax=Amycolatopsis minnesotensis TaxID=337894 RepID=A0ABN2SP33_9PSEU